MNIFIYDNLKIAPFEEIQLISKFSSLMEVSFLERFQSQIPR